MKRMNKKGVFAQLSQLAVGVGTLALVLTVTFLILAEGAEQSETISGTVCNASGGTGDYACNATATMQNAVQTIPGWVPLIIIAFIGSILLGLVALFRNR